MLQRLTPLWRNVALAVVGVLVLWFLWTVRGALNPLGLGLLFAYMLHPLVESLERRGWSRKAAVNFIFVTAAASGAVLTLALVDQARGLWRDVSAEQGALSQIDDELRQGAQRVFGLLDRWNLLRDEGEVELEVEPAEGPGDEAELRLEVDPQDGDVGQVGDGAQAGDADAEAGGELNPSGDAPADGATAADGGPDEAQGDDEDTAREPPPEGSIEELFFAVRAWFSDGDRLGQAGQAGLRAAGGLWAVLRRVFGSLLSFLGYVLLVPVYTWFLLFELERISGFVRRYIPRGERPRFSRIGSQITEMLGNFFRGRMLVCLLKGLVLAVVLALAGFPYSLLVGVVGGLLSLVPFVGPFVGYLLAFLLGLLEFSLGECLVRLAIVYTIGEMMEGYVLLPRVLGDSMGLHPIVVIASLMVFGAAFGMFGMLLALPLTSAAVILARELVLPALADLADGDGRTAA